METHKIGGDYVDAKRKETKRKLMDIESVSKFEKILGDLAVSDEKKEMLRLYYIKRKPLSVIADMLGVSISTVKKWHNGVLSKIGNML